MKSWHKTAAAGVLAAALAVFAGLRNWRPAVTPEQKMSRISDRLLCQCGCGQHLNGCNMHPCGSAYPMRDEINASLTAGRSEDDIVRSFVEKMGAKALAAPPAEGFALTAWVMPFAALLLGLVVIYRVVRSQRAQPAPAAASGRQHALLSRYGAAIDEELEREE